MTFKGTKGNIFVNQRFVSFFFFLDTILYLFSVTANICDSLNAIFIPTKVLMLSFLVIPRFPGINEVVNYTALCK